MQYQLVLALFAVSDVASSATVVSTLTMNTEQRSSSISSTTLEGESPQQQNMNSLTGMMHVIVNKLSLCMHACVTCLIMTTIIIQSECTCLCKYGTTML